MVAPSLSANETLIVGGKIRMPNSRELLYGLAKTEAYFARNASLFIGHPRNDTSSHGDLVDAVMRAAAAASEVCGPVKKFRPLPRDDRDPWQAGGEFEYTGRRGYDIYERA